MSSLESESQSNTKAIIVARGAKRAKRWNPGRQRSGKTQAIPTEGSALVGAPDLEDSGNREVIGFYGHGSKASYPQFSNFFWQSMPTAFELPEFAVREGWPLVVQCDFSEKAIMITKAALMGDRANFDRICVAKTPAEAKSLGRNVTPWDDRLWSEHVEEVAFQVVRQKFASDSQLTRVLLSTGEAIIAEASRRDKIWGIGIDVGDERVQNPKMWQGRNLLGFALMNARRILRHRSEQGQEEIADLA